MELSFRTQFAFPGGKLEYVDDDHAVYIHGNGIAILDMSCGTYDFVTNVLDCRLGISAFTTHVQKNLIAIAPRSTKAKIHVLHYPEKESKSILKHGTDLEYETLAISQSAEFLCGLSGPFDHHLYLWSLTRSELIATTLVNVRKESPFNLHACSFNPRNHSMICTVGSHGLSFWKVEAMASEYNIRKLDATLVSHSTVEIDVLTPCHKNLPQEEKESDDSQLEKHRPMNSYNCQCWADGDLILAVNRINDLMEFDANSGRLVRLFALPGVEPDSCCVFVTLLRDHVLLAFSDGIALGVNANKLDALDFRLTMSQSVKFSHCNLTPCCDQLVMTAPGKISFLSLGDTEELDCKQAPSSRLLDFHTGPVLALGSQLVSLDQTRPVLLTSGLDGCLKVWSDTGGVLCRHTFRQATEAASDKSTLESSQVGSGPGPAIAITSLATAPHDSMALIGTAVGSLHLLYLISESQSGEPDTVGLASLGNLQLSHSPTSGIIFHPNRDLIAAACKSELHIIELSHKSSNPLSLLASTTNDEANSSLLWHDDLLLVACIDSTVSCFCMSDEGQLDENNLHLLKKMWSSKIGTPLTAMLVLESWCSNGDVFVCGASPSSCQLLLLSLPDLGGDTKLTSAKIGVVHKHGFTCLKTSPCGTYLAAGSADGRLILLQVPTESGAEFVALTSMDLHVGPIVCVDFSRDVAALYSSGLDGSVFSLTIPIQGTSSQLTQRTRFQQLAEKLCHIPIRAIPILRTTWHETHQKKVKESAMLEAEAHKAVQRNVLADLRRRLQELLAKNEVCSDIEKLQREDFVVDLVGREKILVASRERAGELEAKLKDEDTARSAISSRIRSDCWDSMEVQATECRAFQRANMLVSNFPLKRRTLAETRRIECIRVLRKLELRDIALSGNTNPTWPRNLGIIPTEISWILNQGELRPVLDVVEKSSINDIASPQTEAGRVDLNIPLRDVTEGPDDEEEEDGDIQVREEEALDINSLLTQLYPPLALETSTQRRAQQALLSDLVYHMQVSFNSRFQLLYDDKRNEMDRIGEKNTRVGEILGELGSKEDYFKPVFAEPDETPDVVIQVMDSELSCTPPDSDAVRIMRQKAEEQRERLLGTGDNAGERALQDMMYGTLETKKDADLFQTELKPPSWFHEFETMELTDSQKKELDEYNSAKAILEEHQEKYRKALELEFKKLRTEVGDITRNFDDRVRQLSDQRVTVMNAVMTQELYSIRIGVGMLEHEADVLSFTEMNSSRATVEEENTSFQNLVSRTGSLVDAAAERVEIIQNEDKLLERNFKRDLQLEHQPDQESFKIILAYYRDRHVDPHAGANISVSGAPGMKPTANSANVHDVDDAAMPELPESFKLDESTWSTLEALRKSKITKEKMLSSAIDEHSLLKMKYEESLEMLNSSSADLAGLKARQISLKSKLEVSEQNTEILVRVRQGQDELEQEAVVTEYCDAVLLPVETISVVNQEIRRLGLEQVKTLNKIKHFRKSINFMEWENRYMKEQSHDLEEYYTDLQLLHVTKNLQSVMKGDQSNSERERIAKAEARVTIMNRVHEKKCSKLVNVNSKLAQQIRGREEENERLKQQLNEIGDAVSVREAIVRSRLDSSAGEGDSERRTTNNMKRITLRRRLIDLVRCLVQHVANIHRI